MFPNHQSEIRGSMCDEDIPSQQTTMVPETTMQSMLQTMIDDVMGKAMDKMMSTMTQKMTETARRMMTMMNGNHAITTSDVIEACHTATQERQDPIPDTVNQMTTPVAAAAASVVGDDDIKLSHLAPPPTTASGGVMTDSATAATDVDEDDEDNMDAMSLTPPPVVVHHDTQQFAITPIVIPPTIESPTNFYPFPEMKIKGRDIIIPSMVLYVLVDNPDILLPLASFQASLFDHIHALNKFSFHASCVPIYDLAIFAQLTLLVVSNRIRSALDTLYPKAGIYGHKNDDEMKAMALELEKGPVDVLESIVRDGLEVWNPIRVLITHLEGVTTQYSRCTTPEAQKALRWHIVKEQHNWMGNTTYIALVYGLYLWDSQWVSDDEWDTLVKHMTTLTTEIFPEAYDSLLKTTKEGDSKLTLEEHKTIDYFRHLLGIISCCFLHHYRPIKRPISLPYRGLPSRKVRGYDLLESEYEMVQASSTELVKQCVTEYMDRPTAFPQLSQMENLLHSTTTTDDYPSPRDYIMSEVDLACASPAECASSSSVQRGDNVVHYVTWEPSAVIYFGVEETYFLSYRIICSPPRSDAVHKRIATIYPTDVHRMAIISVYYCTYDSYDPQFRMEPIEGTRDDNPPQSLEEVQE